ncbi:hypothetical protein LMANV2_90082 [Leptospira interrogans serovar Manilae]|uniref:Uncharacterized protein n=1 Tax=Leptospira interrogans serovar Manilae TaxID=214675 RepID=A0AAQ1P3S8_LEPIR|nr:hypothetical protein LMANV2_90082 [Leptospira interrogans serovar Manilae]
MLYQIHVKVVLLIFIIEFSTTLIHVSLKFDHKGLKLIQQTLVFVIENFDRRCVIKHTILSSCITESKSKFFIGNMVMLCKIQYCFFRFLAKND